MKAINFAIGLVLTISGYGVAACVLLVADWTTVPLWVPLTVLICGLGGANSGLYMMVTRKP